MPERRHRHEPALDEAGAPCGVHAANSIARTTATAADLEDHVAPTNGTLTDQSGAPVTLNQTFSTQPTLVYTPNTGLTGTDGFQYEVLEGLLSDSAIVTIDVQLSRDGCAEVGRPPGCQSGS